MMAIGPILSLLPITLIFLLVVRTRVTLRQARTVFSLYLLLLLAFTGAFYFVAEAGETGLQDKKISEQETEVRRWEFYAALEEGRLAQLENVQRSGYWSFTYRGDKLHLASKHGEYFEPLVVIERKEENDESIEVISYTTAIQPDWDDLGNPPRIMRREDSYLELINPDHFTLTTFGFTEDRTMQQFSGDNETTDLHSNIISLLGEQAVVIRVPKDLSVEVDSGINLVNPEHE